MEFVECTHRQQFRIDTPNTSMHVAQQTRSTNVARAAPRQSAPSVTCRSVVPPPRRRTGYSGSTIPPPTGHFLHTERPGLDVCSFSRLCHTAWVELDGPKGRWLVLLVLPSHRSLAALEYNSGRPLVGRGATPTPTCDRTQTHTTPATQRASKLSALLFARAVNAAPACGPLPHLWLPPVVGVGTAQRLAVSGGAARAEGAGRQTALGCEAAV